MIKLTELRVGNLFDYEGDALPVLKIDGDSKKIFIDLLLGLNVELSEEDLKPIPLTPEWLERCGFEGNRLFLKKTNRWSIEFAGEGSFIMHDNWDESAIELLPNVQYLHQLQNLYFALTGEELQIKDT